MPFAGYKDFDDCVSKNRDKDDPEAYCGSIKHKVEKGELEKARDPSAVCGALWFHGTERQRGAFGSGTEGRSRSEKPPKSWWDDCIAHISKALNLSYDDLFDIAKILKSRQGERWFEGWGSVEIVDRQGDMIPIEEFRPVLDKIATRYNRIFDNHTDTMVGEITKIEIRDKEVEIKDPQTGQLKKEKRPALWIRGFIYDDYELQKRFWEALKRGERTGLSLRGGALDMKMSCADPQCSIIHRIPQKLEITAFSIVNRPANPEATIDKINTLAKAEDESDDDEEEEEEKDDKKEYKEHPEKVYGLKRDCNCGEETMTEDYITKKDFEEFKKAFLDALSSLRKDPDPDPGDDADPPESYDTKPDGHGKESVREDEEKRKEQGVDVAKAIAELRSEIEILRKAIGLRKSDVTPAPSGTGTPVKEELEPQKSAVLDMANRWAKLRG